MRSGALGHEAEIDTRAVVVEPLAFADPLIAY